MENEEELKVDLKKFKGHHRKFPWALIIRIIVAIVSVGIIVVLLQFLGEVKARQEKEETLDTEIEIEF